MSYKQLHKYSRRQTMRGEELIPSYEEIHIIKKLDNVAVYHTNLYQSMLAQAKEEIRPIIRALTKEPSLRSSVENKSLIKYFRERSCFKDLTISSQDGNLLKVVNSATIACVPKYDILFRIGERGRCFYISLTGKAQLFILNPKRAALRNDHKEVDDRIKILQNEANEYRSLVKVDPIQMQVKLNEKNA